MIYGAGHFDHDVTLAADAVVVGSGAGGASAALELASAGHRVVVLEAGSLVTHADATQIECEMLPRLYQDAAARTTHDRAIHVHQGRGVGGSTLHNLNLCARIPAPVLARWRDAHGLADLPALEALYDEVEARHGVSLIPDADVNGNNRVFQRGVEALGWRGGRLRHNRIGCAKSGFCELGCPFDGKQNALKVSIAGAVGRGASVLADTFATRVLSDGRRATGVEAIVRDPATHRRRARVRVEARAVCLAASATGTPALLRRSEVPDPRHLVGSRLYLHPGAAVAGVFAEELDSWKGVPQSYECTELLDFERGDARVWLVPAFAHPAGVSAILGGFGADHRRALACYPHLAAASAMVHDETCGRVAPAGDGVRLDYTMNASDRAQLVRGLRAAARILLAAGAERVIVPLTRAREVTTIDELERADLGFRAHELDVTSVHPMGSVWMGDDPETSCVSGRGAYHRLEGLYVADASLFCGSIGVPPQITTYVLGTHVGRSMAACL